MRPSFYDYDYSGYSAKPLDYVDPNAPVITAAKCKCCGYNLGLQDPGEMCGHCKFVSRQSNYK